MGWAKSDVGSGWCYLEALGWMGLRGALPAPRSRISGSDFWLAPASGGRLATILKVLIKMRNQFGANLSHSLQPWINFCIAFEQKSKWHKPISDRERAANAVGTHGKLSLGNITFRKYEHSY